MNIDYYIAELIANGVTYITFADYRFAVCLHQCVDGRSIVLQCESEPPNDVIESITKIVTLAVDAFAEHVEAEYCVRRVPFNK